MAARFRRTDCHRLAGGGRDGRPPTVWLVVVVTADRYVAICRPLHAAQYSTVSRVRRAVATVWIVPLLSSTYFRAHQPC